MEFILQGRDCLVYNWIYNRGNSIMIHPYAESRKRARKRWRQSSKGKAWDRAYGQRPEVKARRKEYIIQRIIKECAI